MLPGISVRSPLQAVQDRPEQCLSKQEGARVTCKGEGSSGLMKCPCLYRTVDSRSTCFLSKVIKLYSYLHYMKNLLPLIKNKIHNY